MDAKTIGNKIAELRKQRGYTQAELADKVGVTNKAVSKWERGVNFPDMGIIDDLAEVLGTTTSELMENEESRPDKYKYLVIIPLIAEIALLVMIFLVMDSSKTSLMIMFALQMIATVGLLIGMLVCKRYIWGNKKDYDTDNILLIDLITLRNHVTGENEEIEENRNTWPMIISTAIFILLGIAMNFFFMEGTGLMGYFMAVVLVIVYFLQLIERYDKKGNKLLINASIMAAIVVALIVLGLFFKPELYVV